MAVHLFLCRLTEKLKTLVKYAIMYTLDEIEELAKEARISSLKKCLVFLLIVLAILGTLYYFVLSSTPTKERMPLILIGSICSLGLVFVVFSVPEKKYKDTKKRLEAENEEEHRRKMEEMLAKLNESK